MTEKNIYNAIAELDSYLTLGLKFFGEFSIVNESELYKKFRLIYDLLPDEIINNENDILKQGENNIFTQLEKLNMKLIQSPKIGSFIIVNTSNITDMIDNIYIALSACKKSIPEFLQKKD